MAAGQSAVRADLHDLVSRLRLMAQGRDTLDIAQLQFVDLTDIQHAYGERWPEQKNKIQDAAEAFLRRRIGEGDLLIRGESGFLVILGTVAGSEAQAFSAQLTHGLNEFFVGDGQSAPIPRFGGTAQTMAVKDIQDRFGALQTVALTPTPDPVERFGLSDLEWRFAPVWDVKREALSYWYVTPSSKATGARVPGYEFENVPVHANLFAKIDEAGLWVGEQALSDPMAIERQTLVGSTVHINTLANLSSRARILATIDQLNPELHRLRIIKVAGVAPGFPRMYLNEIVGALKARLPNVVIGAAWDEPDTAGLLQADPIAIGFVVPTSSVVAGPVVAVPALMIRIGEAVRNAHAHRKRFFVEGGVTKYLAMKFAAAGADNIASTRIWPSCPTAEGMLKWPAERLAAA